MAGNGCGADAGEKMEKSGGDHEGECLAGRPFKLSTSQKMDVKVRNRLTSVRTMVDDRAETRFFNSQFTRDSSCGKQEMPENVLIRIGCFADSGNGFAGSDQNMGGRLWRNIPESTADFIAMNDICRNLTIVYFFKNRFHVGGRITVNAGIASLGNGRGFHSSALQMSGKTI